MSQPTTPPRRRGLGRGLDALLARTADVRIEEEAHEHPSSDEGVLDSIPVDAVAPNPEQPRRSYPEDTLEELAASIRIHGVLQPIIVEEDGRGGYRLVAGERRLRAARRAGLRTISALVRPATESARHALELALVENLQRSDLGPLEEAAAYARLHDAFGLSHEAVGLRVGRSRTAVSNTLRLLGLPPPVQAALAAGRLTAGHARALLALPDGTAQEAMAERVIHQALSVRETERAVQTALTPATAATRTRAKPAAGEAAGGQAPADDQALTRGLEHALGTPVRLERRRRGGRIVIAFYTDDQLDSLYSRLGGAPL